MPLLLQDDDVFAPGFGPPLLGAAPLSGPGPPVYDASRDDAYDALVLADMTALGGYWKMNEASGLTLYDRVMGNDLTLQGVDSQTNFARGPIPASPQNLAPLFGGGGNADGTPCAARTGMEALAFRGRSPFTLELWVYPMHQRTGTPSSMTNVHLWTIGDSASANDHALRILNNGTVRMTRVIAGAFQGNVGPALRPFEWAHVVTTYDGSSLRMYVNGVLAATTADTNSMADNYLIRFVLANAVTSGGSSVAFRGMMNRAAIYATALSAAQISAHYAGGVATSWDPTEYPYEDPNRIGVFRCMPFLAETAEPGEPGVQRDVSATATGPWEALAPVAATAADGYEAGQGIAASGVNPYETLTGIASTKIAPWEALTGIAATDSLPWEANLGLAVTKADPYETLQALAATRSEPWEALLALSATGTASWEALLGLARTSSDPLEALAALAATSSLPVEALAAIAATGQLPLEALAGLAAISTAFYEALLSLARTGELPWEAEAIVKAVAASSTLPWESLAGLSALTVLPWEAGRTPAPSGARGVGGSGMSDAEYRRILELLNREPVDDEELVQALGALRTLGLL